MKCSNSQCNNEATHIRVDMYDGVIQSYNSDRPYCIHHLAKVGVWYINDSKNWYRESITLEEWELRRVKERL